MNMLCWDDWCLMIIDKGISKDGDGGIVMIEGFSLRISNRSSVVTADEREENNY